jgi:transposase InsO family protein
MNSEMITGYSNAPAALQVQKDLLSAPMSDPTILPDGVSLQREAVTAESIVRANQCSQTSVRQVKLDPVYNLLKDSSPFSTCSFELSEDDLANVFTMLTDDNAADRLIENVPTTNDFVCLDAYAAADPTYNSIQWQNPVDTVPPPWDYGIFPSTGIEVFQAELTPLGAALELDPVPATCNEQSVDPQFDIEFDWTTAEVVFQSDTNGNTIPMATAYCLVKSVNGVRCNRFLKCLFDTGGSKSMAHRSVLPKQARLKASPGSTLCNTIAGNYQPVGILTTEDMKFPEFDANLSVNSHDFLVFEPKCSFDLILGNDFLVKIGLKIHLDTLELEWLGKKIPMNSRFSKERLSAAVDSCLVEREDDDLQNYLDCFAVALGDSTYDKMNVDQAVRENCAHLTESQQKDLRSLLFKHFKLFDGTLHTYNGPKMDIELQDGASPIHRRAYPTPRVHLETFKTEILRLVEIGVLEKVIGPTAWALPSFAVSKKDGKIRIVSDLRELNKVIKPRDYTLPIIQDLIRQRSGFQFMTKIDLSMMFYSFELTDQAKELATISTPFGLFRYTRAPMGLRNSPAFAQAAIEQCLDGIPDVCAYIDDIAIWSDTWEEHVATLQKVLSRLEEAGFSINPLKCDFGIAEGDFLGHWLTRDGIKPWQKKVQSVVDLQRPTNASQVRTFVGLINWYRDFWPRRSHLLSPFTQLIRGLKEKKAPVEWNDHLEKCFQEVKQVIAADALCAYPDHNKPFEIYTDSSDYQLGAAILQDGRPVAYYSKRLSGPQTRYCTSEKEMLAIVATLQEYRTMLFGAKIKIFTDHRNLTFTNLNNQRVLRWRCFLETFNAEWNYHPGKLNVLADAYSRLPKFDYSGPEERQDDLSSIATPFNPDPEATFETTFEEQFAELASDGEFPTEQFLSFMNLPSTVQNPLRYEWLAETQASCAALQQCLVQAPTLYHRKPFGRHDIELICYTQTPDDESSLKIVLTDETVDAAVEYFHLLLNHPGSKSLSHALSKFYHPQLAARISAFNCDICQRTKIGQRGYGHFPPRSVEDLYPWKQCDVDLIGPWYVSTSGRSGKSYEFYALTAIDRATGFPDGIMIKRKTSENVARKFDEVWLSRYPRPEVCAHDQGGEFIGPEFQQLLHDAGIASAPSTARNPQSNAIVERLHLTMGNRIRAQLADENPRTLTEAENIMSKILQDTLHSIRLTPSEATGFAPSVLAFGRDMIYNEPVNFDMASINHRRQRRVDKDNKRINSKRYSYDYTVGGRVMKRIFDPAKLEHRWSGPYEIIQVHVNGNITIQVNPHLRERLNIRRVKPYKQPTPSALQQQQQLDTPL